MSPLAQPRGPPRPIICARRPHEGCDPIDNWFRSSRHLLDQGRHVGARDRAHVEALPCRIGAELPIRKCIQECLAERRHPLRADIGRRHIGASECLRRVEKAQRLPLLVIGRKIEHERHVCKSRSGANPPCAIQRRRPRAQGSLARHELGNRCRELMHSPSEPAALHRQDTARFGSSGR